MPTGSTALGVPSLDDLAERSLATLTGTPGVHRAGLALTEGAGRRLRFTASDRVGDTPRWCHIDAYDDVPLTTVVRTGEAIAGTLDDLVGRFPDYVRGQADTPTAALVSTPVTAAGRVVGGLLALVDDTAALGPHLAGRMSEVAALLGTGLDRLQRRTAADYGEPTIDSLGPGAFVAGFRTDGQPQSVGSARRFLRRALEDHDVDPDATDTAVLCLSEVVTNTVMHTGASSDIRVTLAEELLTVAVRDEGGPHDQRPGVTPERDPLRVHGRGLQILEALTSGWGSEADATGTTVWFTLRLR